MELKETEASLTKQFNARYAKKFAELNKNVYPTAKNDTGGYEVPVPVVGKGGGTLVIGGLDTFSLEPPARVEVKFKIMKPKILIYRLSYPYSECEIAANKPEYFNYLFDLTIAKAIGNYATTVGGPDVVRFGETYCSYTRPDTDGVIFRQLDDMSLELRLHGSWASDVESYE